MVQQLCVLKGEVEEGREQPRQRQGDKVRAQEGERSQGRAVCCCLELISFRREAKWWVRRGRRRPDRDMRESRGQHHRKEEPRRRGMGGEERRCHN